MDKPVVIGIPPDTGLKQVADKGVCRPVDEGMIGFSGDHDTNVNA
jgi:hypothetical protein